MLYLFLFFKQKTAYELRISDWSSDVCSSDLDFAVDGVDLRPECGDQPSVAADQIFMEIPFGDVRHAKLGRRPSVQGNSLRADDVAFFGEREFDAELGLAEGRDFLEIGREHV